MSTIEAAPSVRILDAADRLFYREGIQAIGVERIAAEANVSKRTLYKHYASKDLLVVAYLERRAEALNRNGSGAPVDNILALFDRVARGLATPQFRGCPFVNAVAEFGAERSHPAVAVAERFKRQRLAWLEAQLRALALPDAEGLAMQLALLIEGAVAASLVRGGDPEIGVQAQRAARVLLSAAGVALPRGAALAAGPG